MAVPNKAVSDQTAALIVVALATTLMLQALRVFVGYLVFVVDQSQRAELAAYAFGVFAATALAALLLRLLGPRTTLIASAALLVVARLAAQLVSTPNLRAIFGALAVVGWSWLLLAALAERRAPYGLGLAVGLALDLLIRVATATIDLPWMPGTSAHIATIALALGLSVALAFVVRQAPADRPPGRGPSLLAVGPALVGYHLVAGNLGLAFLRIDGGFIAASAVLALAACAAIAIGVGGGSRGHVWRLVQLSVVVAGAIALPLVVGGSLANSSANALLIILAGLGTSLSLVLALDGDERFQSAHLRRPTLWLTLGFIVEAALLFSYYSATGSAMLAAVGGGLAALVVLACVQIDDVESPAPLSRPVAFGAVVVVVLIVGLRWATWSMPSADSSIDGSLTVMTWNLQSGFALDDSWSLERQAQVIEAEEPDVLILQEVSRGWLVTSYADELLWLSRRLDMPYAWGPASGDDLWGNAMLSRAPLDDVAVLHYRSTENLTRSAVRATVATSGGDVWVIGTHLDNPDDAGTVRLEQVDQLVAFRGARQPAIVAGDLNATPDSDVVHTLKSSGLVDSGANFGADAATSEDERRIDYIFATPDLALLDAHIVETAASDHRAVVATFRLQVFAERGQR